MKSRIPPKLKISVLNRDGLKCLWCGRGTVDGITLDVDHVIAEHWGGETTYENLGTLCSHCNRAKGADYYGSYLLATIFKVKDLEKWFENLLIEHNDDGDRDTYKWQILFYVSLEGNFHPKIIEHKYFISGPLLMTQGIPDTDIKIGEIEKEALFQFKDRIREFLFDNNGFLEESKSMLVFYQRK